MILYGHGLGAPFYLNDNNVLQSAIQSESYGTRPLAYLSFYLNSLVADAFGPLLHWKPSFYYRLGNLLVHILAATTLFGLARELTGRATAAAVAGFLFLVHPVVSQPVMYVSQRFESMAALFMFGSALTYCRFRRVKHPFWLAAAIAFGIAGALSKEVGLILPAWILLLEFTFFGGWTWDRRLLYLVPVGAIMAWPAWTAFRGSGATLTSVPWLQYLLTQGPALAQYLKLCVYPAHLFLFYDFPLVTSFSWSLVLSWAVVIALLITGVLLIRRYQSVGFGILTFFVLLIPVMVLPLPDLIFEHRIYGAFGGIAIAAGTLITTHFRRAIVVMTVALIAALSVRTYERSDEWNQEIPFLESHVAEFPDGLHALSFLALHYAMSGQVIRSIEVLTHAQENLGRFNDYYLRPGSLAIGLNLFTAQMAMGNTEAAGEVLEKLRVIGSDEPAFLQSQANWLLATDQPERAVEAFTSLNELGPDQSAGWRGLRIAYSRLGDETRAEEAARRLTEVRDAEEARNRDRWFIPVRFRTHVIFGMLLMFFVVTFVCSKFVWSTARQRWSDG